MSTRFGPEASAAEIRALAPPPPDVENDVRGIVQQVRDRGDAAVRELGERFGGAAVESLRVPQEELDAAAGSLERAVLEALGVAVANVGAVAEAQLHEPVTVDLPQGQHVEVVEVPVRRAAAYVPGGRAPYPSTVVMCAVTARAAGVEELAVCSPPGPDGHLHPAILAAAALCGVAEVYAMGGAQGIAALALGTESVPRVDVIVGPGNSYVQEAKRQLAGVVGIDGVAGPSELVVVASEGADPELVALDLLAQAEHGPDSLVVAIAPEGRLLDAIGARLADGDGGGKGADAALVQAADVPAALALAEEIAPEHLQLVGGEAEALADAVRFAGCLFVGRDAGTAFGDYVAGSNHVLPTGGAARFASSLGVATFRRRMSRVSLPPGAAARLAPAGAALARTEGFSAHAESMERRA
ncbi:MAG TPA: histidinol dehydrogenase [Thermoleophilaceae bacterium]|nr:histidinol dehydrogenase [Thermoleophilaceae bacterium]